ncbi:MAG: SusC/RagA family TonB-linked outer membrane protein [Alistipes sp.]|jgi:TonB-linked SusC/RagA family outer membrane protein|nr:SusC/RagA family TonB-linked outer membrane protein [Alistipes sp.]
MRKFLLILLLLCFSGVAVFAQTKVASGTLLNENGEPIIGGVVSVPGSTTTVVLTDTNGKFRITVGSDVQSLSFSYLGYETMEVEITPDMVVQMSASAIQITGVVVTGMTKIDRRLFTGSSAQLVGEDVKIAGVAEVSRSLEGRVAGVSVQNVSGTFGATPKIVVRGATSIYGDSSPLWVVDGVIVENVVEVSADQIASGDAETVLSSAVAGLSADDIATWTILKDAAATSIYGAKAKSGVIVITTKSGHSGKATISYNGEFSTRLTPRYQNFNVMSSQDQMSVYQEMQQKGWLNFSQTFRDRETGVYGKMYQLMSTYDTTKGTFLLQNTAESQERYLREAEYRNTDWFKELFSQSITQNHAISISGGSEKSTYRASLSLMNDPGWYKQSEAKRHTLGLKVNHKIVDNLELEIAPRVSYRKQRGPGTLGRTTNVVYGEVSRNFDINPYAYALNASRTLDPTESYTRNYAPFNIFNELDNNYMDYHLIDMTTQANLTWKPVKGLDVSFLASMNYQMSSMEHNIRDNANQAMAYRAMPDAIVQANNSYLFRDPEFPYSLPITVLPNGGIYYRQDNNALGYQYRFSLNYTTSFSDKHIVSLFGAAEATQLDRQQTWFRGWGRQYELGDVPAYAYEVFKKGQLDGTPYYGYSPYKDRSVSFSTNLNYSYEGKYNVMATARYDGSNRLGKSRSSRWIPTWNMGLSWNAHEENFFAQLRPAVSHFKLFGSYGLTADRGGATNADIIYRAQTAWRPEIAAQEPSLYVSRLENRELTYEKKYELNLGMELGMFANRINVDFQHFRRHNFDLIGRIDVKGLGGEVSKFANIAEMDSHGWELSLNTKNVTTKNFRWTTSFIFSDVRVEIKKLMNNQRVVDLVTGGNNIGLVGGPDRVLYSVPFAGLDEEGLPLFYNENGEKVQYINMQNRDNIGFLKYEGPTLPTTTGSLGNMLYYKNFRLNVFISYSFGNKVRLDPAFRHSYNDFMSLPKDFKNRWILPGEENITNIPVIASVRQVNNNTNLRYAYNAYNYSDVRVADGGFVRMKEISLTYDFPKNMISKLSIERLSLKLQGTNLFLIYADKKLNGQDPEFFNSGGVASPMAKQFTLTLSIGM